MSHEEDTIVSHLFNGNNGTSVPLRLLHNAIGYLLCTPADVVNGVVRRFDAGDNGDIAWK